METNNNNNNTTKQEPSSENDFSHLDMQNFMRLTEFLCTQMELHYPEETEQLKALHEKMAKCAEKYSVVIEAEVNAIVKQLQSFSAN
jgi:hypothetical protein